MTLAAAPLNGRTVRLEPLSSDTPPATRAALAEALSAQMEDWRLMARRGDGEAFAGWWEDALTATAEGDRIAYAIRRLADAQVVGTTSFLEISPVHRRVEIGATFLNASARGGLSNPDMKLAMLTQAFAEGAVRVELVTDARNLRSQAAIAKLGALREGVLRRHKITWTGYVRDTVVFAVTDQDWPEVRARLERRLDGPA